MRGHTFTIGQDLAIFRDGYKNTALRVCLIESGGFARVLRFSPVRIEGSAADGIGSCGPGTEDWSALFDGSGLPLDDGEVVSITDYAPEPERWIEVTTTNPETPP